MLARLERLSDEAESYFDEAFAADEQPTPLDPLLKRLDDLLDAAGARVNRWAERGWVEEQHGRRMARQASVSVVDELLDYMARNPEVRELIEQQATSMAGVAVGEVRGRSETADLWIERLAHRVLRRPESETTATDAEGAAARAPAEAQASVAPATRPLPAPANNARAPHAAATVETDAETATRGTSGG
jgi:hypothetical protein